MKQTMLLNRFAAQAKKYLGSVHLTRMYTDQAYAMDIVLHAYTTNDAELVESAKSILSTLKVNVRLIDEIERFLNDYTRTRLLPKVQHHLRELAQYIYNIPVNGAAYRKAVHPYLAQLASHEQEFCVNLVRAFYPYWLTTGQEAEAPESMTDYARNLLGQVNSKQSFIKLWMHVDELMLSDVETQLLTHYAKTMAANGLEYEAVVTRKKIAKILIVELRGCTAEDRFGYRLTVDNIQNMIEKEDLRDFFTLVAREFYGVRRSHASMH